MVQGMHAYRLLDVRKDVALQTVEAYKGALVVALQAGRGNQQWLSFVQDRSTVTRGTHFKARR